MSQNSSTSLGFEHLIARRVLRRITANTTVTLTALCQLHYAEALTKDCFLTNEATKQKRGDKATSGSGLVVKRLKAVRLPLIQKLHPRRSSLCRSAPLLLNRATKHHRCRGAILGSLLAPLGLVNERRCSKTRSQSSHHSSDNTFSLGTIKACLERSG